MPKEIGMFRIGEFVSWTSQSGGNEKMKTGTIIGIVGAHEDPHKRFQDLQRAIGTKGHSIGNPRLQESYIVLVKDGTKGRLYWPNASKLVRL